MRRTIDTYATDPSIKTLPIPRHPIAFIRWTLARDGASAVFCQWFQQHALSLLMVSLLLSLIILTGHHVTISNLTITPSDLATAKTAHTLPKSATKNYTATANVDFNSAQTGLLRLDPAGCIEAVELNGKPVKLVARNFRCAPRSVTVNASEQVIPGPNVITIRLSASSREQPVTIAPMYSHGFIFRLFILSSIILGCLYHLASTHTGSTLTSFSSNTTRLLTINLFPLMATVLLCLSLWNHLGPQWTKDHSPIHVFTTITALSLLLKLLYKYPERVPAPSFSLPLAILSTVALYFFTWRIAHFGFSTLAYRGVGMVGMLAAFFTFIPVGSFLRRLAQTPKAGLIALFVALSPTLYWSMNLPFWILTYPITNTLVTFLLSAIGISATTTPLPRFSNDDLVSEFFVALTSSRFAINIGQQCNGLEGIFLFILLLSVFSLIDWDRLSKWPWLWLAYVATIPYMMLVNALRIAAIFLYGDILSVTKSKASAVSNAVELFHSHIGWILYLLAFFIFISVIRRFVDSGRVTKQ